MTKKYICITNCRSAAIGERILQGVGVMSEQDIIGTVQSVPMRGKENKAYALDLREEQLIRDVRKSITVQLYGEYSAAEDLQELHKLLARMEFIAAGEARKGVENWGLKEHISEVRQLCTRLSDNAKQ
jgi:hypothetical protein